MIALKDFKPIVLPDGSHQQVCTFIQIEGKTGSANLCGEPVDMTSNGVGMCYKHFIMMAEKSVQEMKAYMDQMMKTQMGAAMVAEGDDEEGGAVEVPSFDVKVPDYLR